MTIQVRVRQPVVWASAYVESGAVRAEWVHRVAGAIPNVHAPTHFSAGERLRRRPAFEIGNRSAFDEYLQRCWSYCLHGDGYVMHIGPPGATKVEFEISNLDSAEGILRDWYTALDDHGIVYAYAGLFEECDHRNGYVMRYEDGGDGYGHGWLGREYLRYVPGLYWMNYFSRGYAMGRSLGVEEVARKTAGHLTELEQGYILRLYKSPADWLVHADFIDDVLEESEVFFSMRRVQLPERVCRKDSNRVTGLLAKEWP